MPYCIMQLFLHTVCGKDDCAVFCFLRKNIKLNNTDWQFCLKLWTGNHKGRDTWKT